MACRREGISPLVFAQPGRPASSGSVTLHAHFFAPSCGSSVKPHAAHDAAGEDGDAIGSRRAVREGSLPDDVGVVQRIRF